uniref:Unannotated protein n=1 Tax=freshwater metagenome TaxID=449393 RepID=A0A6J7MYL0_9ZZZZ
MNAPVAGSLYQRVEHRVPEPNLPCCLGDIDPIDAGAVPYGIPVHRANPKHHPVYSADHRVRRPVYQSLDPIRCRECHVVTQPSGATAGVLGCAAVLRLETNEFIEVLRDGRTDELLHQATNWSIRLRIVLRCLPASS